MSPELQENKVFCGRVHWTWPYPLLYTGFWSSGKSCNKETCPMLNAVVSESYSNTEYCFVIDEKPVIILWKNTLGNASIRDNILYVGNVISTGTECRQRLFHKNDQLVEHCCWHTPPVPKFPRRASWKCTASAQDWLMSIPNAAGGGWLPSLKPHLKCRSSQVTVFQAISPYDLTDIYL